MQRFSLRALTKSAWAARRGQPPIPRAFWRHPDPKPRYRILIIGGGGHGLACAYHLARDHGITDVAVLERGRIGGGNAGRNTSIIRSNYAHPASIALYDAGLSGWERLSEDVNFNVLFSPRGILSLHHNQQDQKRGQRLVHLWNRLGVGGSLVSVAEIAKYCPLLDLSADATLPIIGGTYQSRAGIAHHDAMIWGYARAVDDHGIDIIEHCPVTGWHRTPAGRVSGVETARGRIDAELVILCAAGGTPALADGLDLRLPLTLKRLQASVSEPMTPILNTVVLSNRLQIYVSQSDKGELVFGAATDPTPIPTPRHAGSSGIHPGDGDPHVLEATVAALLALFPRFSRLRMLRNWSGVVDCAPDASPIIGDVDRPGVLVNCGWGTGGFKATPAAGRVLAHHAATGSPHPLAMPFALSRFQSGVLIEEHCASGVRQ